MPVRYLALLVALLPLLAANLSYLISAWQGYVDWCVPYWQGCTSISAAGRHGAAYFVFKALMIPAAVCGAFYWLVKYQWLVLLGNAAGAQQRMVPAAILAMGWLAAAGLVLYTTVLGSIGDSYYLQRRIGVIMYFSLTFFAQLLSIYHMVKQALPAPRRVMLAQLIVCASMFGLGLLHLLFELRWPDFDAIDDIIEWNFALLTVAFYLTSFWMWRDVDIRLELRAKPH